MGCIHGVVARDCVDRGDVEGFRTAWLRLQQAPGDFTYIIPFSQQVDPLGIQGRQLRRLFTAGPTDALAAEVIRRRLYEPSAVGNAIARRSDPSTPLLIETPTPLYNAAVAVDAAIVAEEWTDVLRAMSAVTTDAERREHLRTLVPDQRDGDRLVSLPQMMADALGKAAGFREFMLREQAERGRLRMLQLRADGDVPGLTAAASEFQGTPAAADALEWLAERSLAAGDFTAARTQAQSGLQWAGPEARDRLLTIRAMAEAVAGGPVTTVPKTTGIAAVPATDVAAIAGASPTVSAQPTGAVAAFPPTDLDAVQRLDLGPAGHQPPGGIDYPGSSGGPIEDRFVRLVQSPPLFRVRVDWAAETCSFTAAPDRLLVNNRLEMVAVDPATGAEQWRTATGPKPGGLMNWGLVPMRATCDGQHAYVRRLAGGSNASLSAVRLTDGTIAWDTAAAPNAAFVSDPALLYGTLWVCEVTTGQFEDHLSLVAIDPQTGSRRRQRPISGLTRAWRVARPGRGTDSWDHGDCQVAVAGDRLFIAAAGTMLACDADGSPSWMRRQPWVGPAADGWWRFQAQTPPLIHDGMLFVVQPGVQAVAALDAVNGQLRWRTPLPGSRRLIGLAGSGAAARLVVETAEGIVSVDPQTGDVRMILDARDDSGDAWLGIAPTRLLGAALATADGHALVAVQRRTTEPNKPDVLDAAILWIDVASGEIVHTAELPALAGNPPWVGPLASAGGSLWLLAHPNPADLRRSLWQLCPRKN
jgi:outer membrane protein assembly factor BamB